MLNKIKLPVLSILLLQGCAHVPEDAQFNLVAADVTKRSGMKPVWHVGEPAHPQIKAEVEQMLSKPLTEASVVQIALLNNPGLQAKYSELGIAQADLVQAGLIANPTFGSFFGLPIDRGPTDMTFTLTFNFLNILTLPLRKAVAESEYEETRLHMVKFTIDLASQARALFYQAIASQQLKELSDQMLTAANAEYETAKALREAGNITKLDVTLSRTLYEQAEIDNSRAETELYQAKANLALILGIDTRKTSLILKQKLSAPPREQLIKEEMEAAILDKSIDVALMKQRLETLGRKYQITNIKALIPELRIGGEAERDEGDWDFGPTLEYTLPIFDQGQAAIAKAQFEIRGTQEQYAQTVLQVKNTFSILQNRLSILKLQLEQMQRRILPLHQKASNETLLQYNVMNKGIVDLIRVKQHQIAADERYAEILLDYWLTKSAFDQLRYGSLPTTVDSLMPMETQNTNASSGDKH